ncbi:MAG: hypothetical protein IJA85_05485 [Clostridia bacterium]|nr:hypothetical protein [Clostridia bacterium]
MNNEVKKLPELDPKSYGPKKPEILDIAKHTQALNRVKFTENGAYIDNISKINFGEWHECTHSGCMMLLMEALKIDMSYEYLMGVSGSCYRASMAYDWDFGSNIVSIIYALLGYGGDYYAHRACGLDYHNPINDDNRDEQVCESIHDGIPVLVLGGRNVPEWSILLGYEKTSSGIKFFGRSYFDNDAAEDELFTENRYTLLNSYPGDGIIKIFTICDPISPKEALKASLETCVNFFKPHEKFGFGAYRKMIDSFKNNSYTSNLGNYHCEVVSSILINLADARRAASIYLKGCLDLMSGENKDKLSQVTSLFSELFNILNAVINNPVCKFENTPDFKFDVIINNVELRNHVADELMKCMEIEHRIQDLVKEILENWR